MKPINKKERTAMYWKFLVMYIITIAMVIIAVYFNSETSSAAGDELNKIKEEKKVLVSNSKIYYLKMDKVDSLLSLLVDPKVNPDRVTDDIKDLLGEMKELVKKNSSLNDSVYVKIYNRYYDVLQDKKIIQNSNASTSAVSTLQTKITKLTTDLDDCNKQLMMAKAMTPH